MAQLRRGRAPRSHSAHKGRFGDVIAVGGAPGMGGALVLAARAALGGGAGRVFACPLDAALPGVDLLAPELMWRPGLWCNDPNLLDNATVVAGCGGGLAIREALPTLLSRSRRLVLDADALNAVAADEALTPLLLARAGRGQATVLTPHPLEAARLLGRTDAGAVQAQRLQAAQRLADRFECTVLLTGAGSVIAAPRQTPAITRAATPAWPVPAPATCWPDCSRVCGRPPRCRSTPSQSHRPPRSLMACRRPTAISRGR
jgi:NAD(P)H-hydrate repair Nnr-like enzyme with NAD(P)H-hydrate dehydratase domain